VEWGNLKLSKTHSPSALTGPERYLLFAASIAAAAPPARRVSGADIYVEAANDSDKKVCLADRGLGASMMADAWHDESLEPEGR